MPVDVLVACAAVVTVLMVATWMLSVPLGNVSIVDIVWGVGFAAVSTTAYLTGRRSGTDDSAGAMLLTALTVVWGLRLAGYLWWRNHGHGEDFRYAAMRRKVGPSFRWRSLATVFGLQGLLMLIVSMPVLAGQTTRTDTVWPVAVAGVAVWLVGFSFETIGDLQLARFKADPASAGRVMDQGLWRYTRHPNYFGDFCVWWGLWLVAVSTPSPWTVAAVVGPVVMSVMLMRVSGVAMLERTIGRRRPGYEDYVRRTSAFFPRPPLT